MALKFGVQQTNKKKKIQTIQNRIVGRLLPQKLSTELRYDKLKIMNISQVHDNEMALYMYEKFIEK